MTSVSARRDLIDTIKTLPARDRAWLDGDDPGVWAYNGLGVMLNSAQETEINAVLDWPPGTIHVWRFANRGGKTGGLILLHLLCLWRKWRYQNPDHEFWLGYRYKTLHSAPSNRLMGRAWEMVESITKGTSEMQRHPTTFRQRPAPLASLFSAGKSSNPDGSDALWVRCANNAQIDFLSTSEGASRMESEKWWLLAWDEFVRQEPVSDIPLLFDQTFLPRSSDFMAPVILSGTETDDAAPIYAELEEEAASNPRDWNFVSHTRAENFVMSKASIDRQMRVSLDKGIARRSVMGESGEGGRGTLYSTFLLNNAFRDDANMHSRNPGSMVLMSFDHALKGDLSVIRSTEVPWPLPADRSQLIGKIRCIGAVERKSSATLTTAQLMRMLADEAERLKPRWIIIDSTGEGGVAVFREARAMGLPVIDCAFSARLPGVKVSNKEFGLQWLQHMFDWGLEARLVSEDGWVDEWEDPKGPYGLLRIPAELRKDRRELAVLRKDDHNLAQDRAMTWVMQAWFYGQHIGRAAAPAAQSFNIIPKRPRSKLATARTLRGSMVRSR